MTERALSNWLTALPAARYDLRVVPADPDAGLALCRRVSAVGIVRLIPWLRAQNAGGNHVYLRPATPAYCLVDDLDADALDVLLAAGHRPAAIVRTSKGNHQAWLKIAPDPDAPGIDPGLASAAARVAARRFGGDPGAASAVQCGRAPGLVNVKPIHRDRFGRGPFALLVAAPGGLDPGAGALLAAGAAELKNLACHNLASGCMGPGSAAAWSFSASSLATTYRARLRPCTPEEEWAEGLRRVEASRPRGAVLDRSRVDYAVAVRLLGRGAPATYVTAVLLAGARAGEMPRGEAETYVARTIAAAARLGGRTLITEGAGAGERWKDRKQEEPGSKAAQRNPSPVLCPVDQGDP